MDNISNFSFVLPSRIEFGVGKISCLSDELKKLGAKKPLIVTDSGLINTGIITQITRNLNGFEYSIYDKISPNPRDTEINDGGIFARKNNSDCCISVGGGSAMDSAKGIAVMATHSGNIRIYENDENVPGDPLPIISIPTTAGTGAEITFSSVITNLDEKIKFYFRTVKVAAKVAICDPEMTVSMPSHLTASTGMDALTHAIEGLTSIHAEPIASAFALYAIRLISRNIKKAVTDGKDIKARTAMLMGSLLGGLSFSHSSVASVHALAESLGGMYDMPHGVCNSMGLPIIMSWNKKACITKYAEVASAMDISFQSDEVGANKAIDAVRQLAVDVKIPKLSSYNIPSSDFDIIAQKSFENGCNECNPVILSKKDFVAILKEMNTF